MVFGAYTNIGRVKAVNQDSYCFMEARTSMGDAAMAVVCDGVGGLSSGELASTTVVGMFADWFSQKLPAFLRANAGEGTFAWSRLRHVWEALLLSANESIYAYGAQNGLSCGTTFTGMFATGGRYLIGHVGDCRAYELSAGGCEQLTVDQTLVAKQVAAGMLSPEEAAEHPKRNVILQSVGTQEGVAPEFYEGELKDGAVYVLCCDGFYGKLQESEIAAHLAPNCVTSDEAAVAQCSELAFLALERGERDNITALAFACEPAALQDAPSQESDEGETVVVDGGDADDEATTVVASELDDDEAMTVVLAASDGFAELGDSNDDDAPTVIVDPSDPDEAPTVIADPVDPDEAPTVVVSPGLPANPKGGDADVR